MRIEATVYWYKLNKTIVPAEYEIIKDADDNPLGLSNIYITLIGVSIDTDPASPSTFSYSFLDSKPTDSNGYVDFGDVEPGTATLILAYETITEVTSMAEFNALKLSSSPQPSPLSSGKVVTSKDSRVKAIYVDISDRKVDFGHYEYTKRNIRTGKLVSNGEHIYAYDASTNKLNSTPVSTFNAISLDALAYNPLEEFLYCTPPASFDTSSYIYRIEFDGSNFFIARVDTEFFEISADYLIEFGYNCGDCDDNGNYYLFRAITMFDRVRNFCKIDVNPNSINYLSAVALSLENFGEDRAADYVNNQGSYIMNDLCVNKDGTKIYGFVETDFRDMSSTRVNRIIELSINNDTNTLTGKLLPAGLDTDVDITMVGCFMDKSNSQGNLYFIGRIPTPDATGYTWDIYKSTPPYSTLEPLNSNISFAQELGDAVYTPDNIKISRGINLYLH